MTRMSAAAAELAIGVAGGAPIRHRQARAERPCRARAEFVAGTEKRGE
jgi:hypothetical protein